MDRFGVELRARVDGNRLAGHAAVFDSHAEMPSHWEAIAPAAFDEALERGDDVKALWNHDTSLVLGSTASKTLRLEVDERGLAFEVDLPDTSYARDLRELVGRSDVNAMSFGFFPGDDEWGTAPDGRRLRTHTRIGRLVEISPVSLPAYDGTECYLRHRTFDRARTSLREQLVRLRAADLLKG